MTAGRVAIVDDYELILLNEGSLYRSPPLVKHRVRGDRHKFSDDLPRNSGHPRVICVGNRRKSRTTPGQASLCFGGISVQRMFVRACVSPAYGRLRYVILEASSCLV